MNKKMTILSLAVILGYLLFSSYASGPGTMGLECTGATSVAGCAGSTCHGSAATPSTGMAIQLLDGTTPVTQYIAGNSYTIRVRSINTSALILPRFGFQVSAVKTSTTTNAGTLTAPSGAHAVALSGVNVIEHNPSPLPPTTGTGGGGSTYQVDIPWTAPATGTGSITLFAAMNLVNNDGLADANDKWKAISTEITELPSSVGPITGDTTICRYENTTLSNALSGGTWASSAPSIATIGAGTGIVVGVAPGTASITYTTSMGVVTTTVTVNDVPASIIGTASACVGGSTTLSDSPVGGTWNSSNASVATIDVSGVVSGISAGTSTISYILPSGCGVSKIATINPLPDAGSISGSHTVCITAPVTLSETAIGGTWTSSNASIATVSASGIVTGITSGTATISYTVIGGCGSASAMHTVNVLTAAACAAVETHSLQNITTSVQVFPNPFNGTFSILAITRTELPIPITITDIMGKTVAHYFIHPNKSVDIQLRQPTGTYILNAFIENERHTLRIIVD